MTNQLNLDTIRRVAQHEKRFDGQPITDLVSPVGESLARYLSIPCLRGYWPLGAHVSGGNAADYSGQARYLTYAGNPTYNVDGLAPYIDMDGTGDYLSRADEAGLDITGTESYIASAIRGLTFGGWFYLDALVSGRGLASKYNTSAVNERSYLLQYESGGNTWRCVVSVDGSATTFVDSTVTPATASWVFIVGRFDPSTELAIFVNRTKTVNTTSIPASIYSGAANFVIGAWDNGASGNLDGRASSVFLAASHLSDSWVSALFEQQRSIYGV